MQADRIAAVRRFSNALPVGVFGSFIVMTIVFGTRHELAGIARTGAFWAKLAYPFSIAIGAMLAIARLGRPGAHSGIAWALIALPFVAVWTAGALVLHDATPAARLPLLFGQTWRTCPFNILLLSALVFPAVFWSMKALVPTQLRLAGAAVGLLTSSVATVVYCLHCPKTCPAFWSVWYALGMAISASIGSLLGPRLLRW